MKIRGACAASARLRPEVPKARLPSLIADRALDRPAQEHAEAILTALREGEEPDSVEPLASRVEAALAGEGSWRGTQAGLVYWKSGSGRIEPRRGHGQSIVLDAATPSFAVETALSLDKTSDLMEAGFRRFGIGIARGDVGGVPRTVWVAVLLRR